MRMISQDVAAEYWSPSSSYCTTQHSRCTSEHYFARASEPANEVQAYTYRTSGRFIKSDTLKDLPTNVVEKLIGCCLDGVGLGASELELTAEHLIVHPTRYWTNLGNNDYARAKAFVALKKQRESWISHYRVAIARAMNDIRQYVDGPDETRIVPASKNGRKVPQARPSTAVTA
ncbi:hypothetical protein Q1695_005439 [Nippostrongylus brasiliensis]|nr:hypothetical protein Q1695_005439 [Nippostrongylus brasiliensis]